MGKKMGPQQQGDSQTWLLGKTSASPRARRDPRRRSSIRSHRRTGTTSRRHLFFTNPICGKTLASRTKGTKLSSDALKGRVCEVSLGDLKQNEDDAYRKIRLRIEDVQGKQVLCNFWGMDFTTDKLRSLVRKWQSLIESNVDVKTTDGYVLRCFCIGFTKKRQFQIRKTCYSQEDGGHHDQGSGLVRPDQGCGEVRAGVHWQGHYEGLRGYLPAPECVHP